MLAADPGGRIQAGFKPGATEADLVRRLDAGTVAECLHRFSPRPGDCVFLPAGTVHAVGGGVLLAEVQQSSDATFRLFDWNRLGTDGHPRALHRHEALASIRWPAGPVGPVAPGRSTACPTGSAARGSSAASSFASTATGFFVICRFRARAGCRFG